MGRLRAGENLGVKSPGLMPVQAPPPSAGLPSNLQIYALGVEDTGPLATLFAACVDNPWSEAAFAAGLAAPGSLAFAAGMPRTRLPSAAIFFRDLGGEAELLLIGVHPDHRRRGIAKGLLDTGLGLLKAADVHRVYLEVDETNDAARRLYETCGFRQTGRRPAYYPSPGGGAARDAVLMVLDIREASDISSA